MADQKLIDKMLDLIDRVLYDWEQTQKDHNLTARLIAEGAQILKENRKK